MTKRIDISPKTVVTILAIILGVYILFRIVDILLGLFVAFILMTAMNPIVNKLEQYKLPRSLAIGIVYAVFLGLIVGLVALLVPSLVQQTNDLVEQLEFGNIPSLLGSLGIDLKDLNLLSSHLGSIPKVLTVVGNTFSSFFTAITIIMITFYLLLERKYLHTHTHWFFGNHADEARAENFINRVEAQIGRWVHGQATLMTLVGVMTYVGLTILGISSALPLAILAGLLEILPNIGPIIAAIPAIAIAYLTETPSMAVLVTLLYILIQQLENTLIVPQIMKSAVGIHPILTILLLLIGTRLGGIPGAILAVPLFLVIKVTLLEFYKFKHGKDLLQSHS